MTTMSNDEAGNITAEQAAQDVLKEKMADAMLPGYQAEFDAEEAEQLGAFREDALDEAAAAVSGDDLNEDLEPAFLDDDGPSRDLPPSPTITSARELFGLRAGETVSEAVTRQDQGVED